MTKQNVQGRIGEIGKLVKALSELVGITLDDRRVEVDKNRARNITKELGVRVSGMLIDRICVIFDEISSEEAQYREGNL
jgi:hypothetical protein